MISILPIYCVWVCFIWWPSVPFHTVLLYSVPYHPLWFDQFLSVSALFHCRSSCPIFQIGFTISYSVQLVHFYPSLSIIWFITHGLRVWFRSQLNEGWSFCRTLMVPGIHTKKLRSPHNTSAGNMMLLFCWTDWLFFFVIPWKEKVHIKVSQGERIESITLIS